MTEPGTPTGFPVPIAAARVLRAMVWFNKNVQLRLALEAGSDAILRRHGVALSHPRRIRGVELDLAPFP